MASFARHHQQKLLHQQQPLINNPRLFNTGDRQQLIEEVRAREPLWNRLHPQHTSIQLLGQLWREVKAALEASRHKQFTGLYSLNIIT